VPCVRIDLTDGDARALADVLHDVADLGRGSGRRGPNWLWIGSAEAANRVGVEPGTIRGWVSRHGPQEHPFPRPDKRVKGRNFWRKKTIDKWLAERESDK
jgi:hypothetical protein